MRALLFFFIIPLWGFAAQPPANDNPTSREQCELLFKEKTSVRLRDQDGELLLQTGRRQIHSNLREAFDQVLLNGDIGEIAEFYQNYTEALADQGHFMMSSNGWSVISKRDQHQTGFRVYNEGKLSHSFALQLRKRVTEIHSVSPNGDFVILTDEDQQRLELVSTHMGQVLLKRHSIDTKADMQFSADGQFVASNRQGLIEIFKLGRTSAELLSAYNVGSSEVGLRAENLDLRFAVNGLARASYLPTLHRLLTFYEGPEPLLLKLEPLGRFRVESFELPSSFAAERSDFSTQAVAQQTLDYAIKIPRYINGLGLVSKSEELILAVRWHGVKNISTIDVFVSAARRPLKSFAVPGIVSSLALSSDERRLAVSSSNQGGIRIYDFTRPDLPPEIVIDRELDSTVTLAFKEDGTLLVASPMYGELRRFKLP